MKREFKQGPKACTPKSTPACAQAEGAPCTLCKEATAKSYWRDQAAHLYAAERLLYLFYFRQAEGKLV